MAEFWFGCDCPDEEVAEKLRQKIEQTQIFQDGLDADGERVSVMSQQGMLEILKGFCKDNSCSIDVEIWPDGMEYDEAEESGDLEMHTLESE